MLFTFHSFIVIIIAPDEPNFLGMHPRAEGSDFAQQTDIFNDIDDILINEFSRLICYNQLIYEDIRLEPNEYAGLSLGIRDNSQTTILTHVKPMYDQASFLIVDNDSEC